MTPTRIFTKEDAENSRYFNQLDPFKFPAGLLNLSVIQANADAYQASQSVVSRGQRNNRDDVARRRPRLTYSRWNMMISSRYKTELCRQYDEEGICQFEDKCLFAHGRNEIRPLPRHPKYKTELCRDFHETGFCSFGPRCNFIHTSDKSSSPVVRNQVPSGIRAGITINQEVSFAASLNHLIENRPSSNLNPDTPEWRAISPPFDGELGEFVTNGQFGAIGECSSDTSYSKCSSLETSEATSDMYPFFNAPIF